MDRAPFIAWDSRDDEERRLLFLAMFAYLGITDPIDLFMLEFMARKEV